ncbi:MAG: universal stress protein [Fidelibacterota bacterium]
MNKRIVVGLDGSGFAATATTLACQEAKKCDGTVVGVGVVDLEGIEEVERGAPVGSIYFAQKAEEHKLRDALQKVGSFLKQFEETCKGFGVNYELHSSQGVPFRSIVHLSKVADLAVIGLRTYYHFETSSKPGDTLKRVLKNSVCPVLAVPERLDGFERAIIAYDGSMESAKALRAFVNRFQNRLQGIALTLLTVGEQGEEVKKIQKEALDYLACWHLAADTAVKPGKAHEAILEYTMTVTKPLIVMGAFGGGGITELFFGSTARNLIEDSTIPIFFYH